jgi:hypothetical protein
VSRVGQNYIFGVCDQYVTLASKPTPHKRLISIPHNHAHHAQARTGTHIYPVPLISKAKHSASNPTWAVENTPPRLIARPLREPTRQDSSPSGSWCGPFSTLDDEALAASLGRLDEYFAANPRLISVPPDIDQLSSPSHSTFGACVAIYQQSHTMNNMEDYSQSIHSNTALLFSPSSSSSQSLPSDAWLPFPDPTASIDTSYLLMPCSSGMSPSLSVPTSWNHQNLSSTSSSLLLSPLPSSSRICSVYPSRVRMK